MESVGRLAGGVAHDFNNMIGVILGYTELALQTIVPDHPLYTHFQQIHKAAGYSAELTRQLLAFARKQTASPEILDLNETMAEMLEMLKRLISEDINLSRRPGKDL
jgi:signal transduction histidine kinase